MGHVTDGGLEPEPDASIKAAQPGVNSVLARIYGNFGQFLWVWVLAGGVRGPAVTGLSGLGGFRWRARQDSNPQPLGPKPSALSIELQAHS